MATLHYFNGRGRAELIRMTLCVANAPFTEKFIKTREDFLALKEGGKLLFGQVPLLEVDGKCIVQTNAILNLISERHGLGGKNEDERIRINELFEGGRDFQMAFLPIGFRDQAEVLQAAKETTMPKMLPIFEKELDSSTGYLVGESISMADCSLLEALLSCLDYFGPDAFKGYPNIQRYVEHMKADKGIQHYLENVRQKPNDDKYIQEVQTSLGRNL